MKVAIFDLDNTLLHTEAIKDLREQGASIGRTLSAEHLAKTSKFPCVDAVLSGLRQKGVTLCVLTNSPRWYATQLLAHHGIAGYFAHVVTHSDVGRLGAKPSPKGVHAILEAVGGTPELCVLVGDSEVDVIAAYRAAVTPIVPAWSVSEAITVPPSGVLSSEKLLQLFDDRPEFKLFAERAAESGSLGFRWQEARFLPLDADSNVVTVEKKLRVFCLGRYYSQKGATTARLHDVHPLSKEIFRKDRDPNYQTPDYWPELLARVVRAGGWYIYGKGSQFDLVTTIPSKPGKPRRLEPVAERAAQLLPKQGVTTRAATDILYFDDGCVRSLKAIPRDARAAEQEAHLHARDIDLTGMKILVFDDVVTSGATMNRALDLLHERGADAYGLALAKTVSIFDEARTCEKCGRAMVLATNSQNGKRFWSCTGYGFGECRHTAEFSVGICPNCGGDLVQKTRKRDQAAFIGCRSFPSCKYTRDK